MKRVSSAKTHWWYWWVVAVAVAIVVFVPSAASLGYCSMPVIGDRCVCVCMHVWGGGACVIIFSQKGLILLHKLHERGNHASSFIRSWTGKAFQ